MSAFTAMIPPMIFMDIQKAISLIIANEMVSQKAIFVPDIGNEQAFNNDYSFKVSNGLYFPKDISEFPLLNVYFEEINNNGENDDIQGFNGSYILNLDMYIYRADATQSDGSKIDGSTGADNRLNYFASQVYRIMEAQVNNQFDKANLTNGFDFRKFKKDVNHPNVRGLSFDVAPLFGRLTYEIKITENKQVNMDGTDIEAFLSSLNINEKDVASVLIPTGD